MTHTHALVVAPPSAVSSPRSRVGRRIGWTFVLLSALAIVAFSAAPYFTASLGDLAADDVGLASTYASAPPFVQGALYVHIVGGAVALVVGPLQSWRGLRARVPRVHRLLGRTYLISVAVASVGGLMIAPSSPAGFVGFFGFSTLAVLWLITGWRAYRSIRRGDVPSHNAWMIRNYALTFAGVTLRIWLPLLLLGPLVLGLPWEFDAAFANAYAAVPFLCWLPNLLVAEWLIRRRGLPSYRTQSSPVGLAPGVSRRSGE
ncbi:DUF2306 domain-containing protein [Microbacterium lacus]|uniref:DUF2306 domain-containing protein n=1 Tax=Microbacterium lacus TaxID=415217 RepID=UPI00384D92EB